MSVGVKKTDAELSAQIDAGIKANGNREITPAIHNPIEQNIVASKISKSDGGLVVDSVLGYSTLLTILDDKSFVYKKYVDDLISSNKLLTDWSAGLYKASQSVIHNYYVWVADVDTSEEPGTGSDWSVRLKSNSFYTGFNSWSGDAEDATKNAIGDTFDKIISIFDYDDLTIKYSDGNVFIDITAKYLRDNDTIARVLVNNGLLNRHNNSSSIDWENDILYDDWATDGDFKFTDDTKGPVIADRNNPTNFVRIFYDSSLGLQTEPV